jgi:peptide/nickel transport system ATP-binding protein
MEVRNLNIQYHTSKGKVSAVQNMSFGLDAGASMALVGESGSGKTSLAMTLLRRTPANAEINGEVLFAGQNLLVLSEAEMRSLRWRSISMIFQTAMNALNPVCRVGDQIIEVIQAHEARVSRQDAAQRVKRLFDLVGLLPGIMTRYPHECSGGMRQRVIIAMALACNPQMIVADEPTTALDVIAQDKILQEIATLSKQRGMSVLYISHDIAAVSQVADYLGIMYCGCLVEYGLATDVLAMPLHPYTTGLLAAMPRLLGDMQDMRPIPGEPPNPLQPPTGCRFHPRCTQATDRCRTEAPRLQPAAGSGQYAHSVACWQTAAQCSTTDTCGWQGAQQ